MKKMCLYEKLNNERGAAAVLALSVIMVLTALGLIALMSSAANVGMSGKTTRWTEDFYKLDAKASNYEKLIDGELIRAEEDARNYVMNRMDRLQPDELFGDYVNVNIYDMKNSGAQTFFNNYYRVDWTYFDGTSEHEYSVEDYIDYPSSLADISKWYEDWIAANPLATPPDTNSDKENAYISDITSYTSELFDRVYFYLLSKRLENLVESAMFTVNYPGDIVIKRISGTTNYGDNYNESDQYSTYKFNNFYGTSPLANPRDTSDIDDIKQRWLDIEPHDDDIGIYIRVNEASLNSPTESIILDDLKNVHVYLSIIKPVYETVLKHIYTPFKGNPVWANALSVDGNITFNDNAHVTVNGDVYASGNGEIEKGIFIRSFADVKINGNVYTRGDLQVLGNNGHLLVSNNTLSYIAKNKIYDDNGLHFVDFLSYVNPSDPTDSFSLNSYTSEYTDPLGRVGIPLVFSDNDDKGNVYCRDLIAGKEDEAPISGAYIKATGNIWTSDDIQMEAVSSTIEVGNVLQKTYYIGLNPFSALGNLNESSAVINNYPFTDAGIRDSKIVLNSDIYIPGTAFYKFATGPDGDPAGNPYYKSLESVASRKTQPDSIINAYLYKDIYGGSSVLYKDADDAEFEVFSTDDETVRRNAFADFVASYGAAGIQTNILTDKARPEDGGNKFNGYVAEIAMIEHSYAPAGHSKTVLYANTPGVFATGYNIPSSSTNNDRYSDFTTGSNNYFLDIFEAKTTKLGTNEADGDFNNFIDDSVPVASYDLINRTSTGILDLEYYNEGIVYCDGNLIIRDTNLSSGANSFRGAIICTGNVTIENGVTINYDEDIILGKLKYSSELRKFFEKGNRGKKVADYIEYSTSSGTRRFPKRYKIKEWRELSEPLAP